MRKEKGFTLVELIIVIIILGILAAYAVPKFISMERAAKIATIEGIAGSMRSASAMIHGLAVSGGVSTGTVTAEGASVNVTNGWAAATAAGIGTALSGVIGGNNNLNVTEGSNLYQVSFGSTATAGCMATYDASASTASQGPNMYVNTTAC